MKIETGLYYVGSSEVQKTKGNNWRVELFSAVDTRSNMPGKYERVYISKMKAETEKQALNLAIWRKEKTLRTYYHGSYLVQESRSKYGFSNEVKTLAQKVRTKYGSDWTYTNPKAQSVVARLLKIKMPSASQHFIGKI